MVAHWTSVAARLSLDFMFCIMAFMGLCPFPFQG